VVLDSKIWSPFHSYTHVRSKTGKVLQNKIPAGSTGPACHPDVYRLCLLCSPYSYRCAGGMQPESGLDSRIFTGNGEFSRDAPELKHTTIAEDQIRDPNGYVPP
jgi:hypothetical protein